MKDIFYFIFFPPSYPNFQIHIPVNLKIKKLWPYSLILLDIYFANVRCYFTKFLQDKHYVVEYLSQVLTLSYV